MSLLAKGTSCSRYGDIRRILGRFRRGINSSGSNRQSRLSSVDPLPSLVPQDSGKTLEDGGCLLMTASCHISGEERIVGGSTKQLAFERPDGAFQPLEADDSWPILQLFHRSLQVSLVGFRIRWLRILLLESVRALSELPVYVLGSFPANRLFGSLTRNQQKTTCECTLPCLVHALISLLGLMNLPRHLRHFARLVPPRLVQVALQT